MRIKITTLLACLFCFLSASFIHAQVTYFEPFTSSLNTATATNSQNGSWIWSNSCSRSSMTGHSATGHALFSGSNCLFGNSSNTVAGDLITPQIAVGNLGAILTFNYALENECGANGGLCTYDVLRLQISNNGGTSYTTIKGSSFNTTGLVNGQSWMAVSYTLSNYINQNIIIKFNFNSGDGIDNAYDGVYVDDIKVEDIQPCTGTPASNTTIPSTTLVCPGAGNSVLTLANGYALGNITYAWQTATLSNIGPYVSVPGANLPAHTTSTLNMTTWYQVVITCQNSGLSFTTAPVQINVASTTTNTVPYFEGFEGIQMNNQLPNCSWSATSPTVVARTYTTTYSQNRTARTGNKFASFYYFPSGTNYFFSNGILLHAGVTYSASVWYATESYGDLNWSDMSLLVGLNQSTTGLVPIVSSNGPASSSSYKALSKTFSVSATGLYYVAIRGTSSGACCAQHLNWDDLAITVPCSLNTPTFTVAPSASVICSGETVSITATGADSYTWNTGATGSQITDMPTQNVMYSVIGTNTASGCSALVQSQQITVYPSPLVSIIADKVTVCAGKPVVLNAVGASTYSWTTQSNSNFITVVPLISTTYSVIGMNAFGCSHQTSQLINVLNLPPVTASADRTGICQGESVTLTGAGAQTYQWVANTLFVQNFEAVAAPVVPTTYTLTGTNTAGCSKTATLSIDVQACVGIEAITTTPGGVRLYPNPTDGIFTLALQNNAEKNIILTDVTGRLVLSNFSTETNIDFDIRNFASGVYYLRVQSNNAVEVLKILKQ